MIEQINIYCQSYRSCQNAALYLLQSDTPRVSLHCIGTESVSCKDRIYGTMDVSLANAMMSIIINETQTNWIIMDASYCNIALDNIKITLFIIITDHIF